MVWPLVESNSLLVEEDANPDEWLDVLGAADIHEALWKRESERPVGSPAVAILVKLTGEGKPGDVTLEPRGVSTMDIVWPASKLFERAPESVMVMLPDLRLEVRWG